MASPGALIQTCHWRGSGHRPRPNIHDRHALEFPLEVVAEHAETGGAEDALGAALFECVPFTATLECPVHLVWILIGPVGKQDNMVMIGFFPWLTRFNNNGAINTALFLQAGVGVIPVGSTLAKGKLIGEYRAGTDRGEAEIRYAVHIRRHEQTVPVDGVFDVLLFSTRMRARSPSLKP